MKNSNVNHPACMIVATLFVILSCSNASDAGENSKPETGQRPPLTAYRIYHETEAPPSIRHAAKELQSHLQKALGKKLEIVHEPTAPMISLGDNPSARDAGFDTSELPWEASRVATSGDDVFIVGRDLADDAHTPLGGRSYGTLYGTLAFLERVAGVRWLMPGEHGTFVPNQPELRVPDLSWIEQPGMEFRKLTGVCEVGTDWYLYHRFDQNVPMDSPHPIPAPFPPEGRSGTGGSMDLRSGHNWDFLFPAEDHPYAAYFDNRQQTYAASPGFFAMSRDGARIRPPAHNIWLCLSHPEIDAEVARRAGILMDREKVSMVSIWPTDAAPHCDCVDCQKRLITPDKRYFAEDQSESEWSAVVFDHYRKVAERVAQTHPDKFILGGIYYKHEVPYPEMKPLPCNFLGHMAPVRIAYGPQRLVASYNQAWHNLLEDWQPLCPNMVYYGCDFWMRDYSGAPMPPYLGLMRDTFSTLHRLGYKGASFYGTLGYGRGALLNYMLAKLLWDPARDPEDVFNEFCDAAYGEGSEQIKQLYLLVDRRMKSFFENNIQDKIHYNTYPEMLRDVYGVEWPRIQSYYLAALESTRGDAGATWRLEQLGNNLQLLYCHLTRLGLVETDKTSPLYLTDGQMEKFNASDMRRAPWAVAPIFANPHLRDALRPVTTITGVAPPDGAPKVGSFWLRYHQDVLIAPDRDGLVSVELAFETDINRRTGIPWLPDFPYYAIYDLETGQSVAHGLASEGGRWVKFQGEKGRLYVLIISATGRYLSGTRYTIRQLDAPWALGTGVDPLGARFFSNKTPLYFYVPGGLDDFELHVRGRCEADILDPKGNLVGQIDCKESADIKVDAAKSPSGFWSIRFSKPTTPDFLLRQDSRLGGYFSVDPERLLAVERKNPAVPSEPKDE